MPASNAPKTAASGPYQVGRWYTTTEVLGWWLQKTTSPPEWIPVIGSVHQDTDHFDLDDHHLHIDARFLNDHVEDRARRNTEWRQIFSDDDWHHAYRVVISEFPVPDREDRHFVVKNLRTAVYTHDPLEEVEPKSPEWGLRRIRLRRRLRQCRRPLPAVEI